MAVCVDAEGGDQHEVVALAERRRMIERANQASIGSALVSAHRQWEETMPMRFYNDLDH